MAAGLRAALLTSPPNKAKIKQGAGEMIGCVRALGAIAEDGIGSQLLHGWLSNAYSCGHRDLTHRQER